MAAFVFQRRHRSDDMSPCLSGDHAPDSSSAYSEAGSEAAGRLSILGAPTYLFDHDLSQLCPNFGFTSWRSLRMQLEAISVSLRAVLGILGAVSEVQVDGVGARRVVAFVEYPEALRDRSVVQFPRDAMRAMVLALPPDGSVAKVQARAMPAPARAERGIMERRGAIPGHSRPEALSEADRPIVRSVATDRTEASASTLDLGRLSVERRAALLALQQNRIEAHRGDPLRGVTPPAVSAARGFRVASIIALPIWWRSPHGR